MPAKLPRPPDEDQPEPSAFRRERMAALRSMDPTQVQLLIARWHPSVPVPSFARAELELHKARLITDELTWAERNTSRLWLQARGYRIGPGRIGPGRIGPGCGGLGCGRTEAVSVGG